MHNKLKYAETYKNKNMPKYASLCKAKCAKTKYFAHVCKTKYINLHFQNMHKYVFYMPKYAMYT